VEPEPPDRVAAGPVALVAYHGASYGSELDAYLVPPPGLERQLDEAEAVALG